MSLRFSVSKKHRKSQKIYLTERLVRAFITSRPDVYCNSSLYGLPAKGISKSLRLQNSAARLVMKCKLRDHIASSPQKLSVLSHRMTFKIIKVRSHYENSAVLIVLRENQLCKTSTRHQKIPKQSGTCSIFVCGPLQLIFICVHTSRFTHGHMAVANREATFCV